MKLKNWIGLSFLALSLALIFSAAGETHKSAPSGNTLEPQWSANGLEINNTLGNTPQQNPKILSDQIGSIFMVWEDGRFGNTSLFSQKINSSGARLWGTDGAPVSTSAANQNSAALADDGSGGMIIVWQDYRNENSDIYAQRLDPQGNPLWKSEGIPVCKAPAGQFSPQLVPDGLGGAIIAWHDYRSGKGEDIFAQRLGKDGFALWEKEGIVVCEAGGTQWYPKIKSDGAGGAIVVWTDGRQGSSNNDIYGQRLSPAGKLLWENEGIALCSAQQNQERPEIEGVADGAIVVWEDSRAGNIDIFSQKIGLDGKPRWLENGVAVSSAPFSQERPRLATQPALGGSGTDDSGSSVIVWTDNRKAESAIYGQKLSGEGRPLWEENGRAIAKSMAAQENPQVINLQKQDWFIAWEEFRKGFPQIFGQLMNDSGTPLTDSPIPFGRTGKTQEKASIAVALDGNIITAWQDRRNGNFDLFAQKLSLDGLALWGEGGLLVCNAIGSVVHQNICAVDGGKGETLVAFEDGRSGFINIYIQKISRAGTLLWGKDGIPVAKVNADQSNPKVVTDGSGGAILTWEDSRDVTYTKVYAQRVSGGGKRLWEKGSLPVAKIDSRQSHPEMISDGKGGAIVVWQDERDPLGLKDLYGQKISAKGELLWDKSGKAVCSENGDQAEASLASDNFGGAFISWTDYRHGDRNPDIFAQHINSNGSPGWEKGGVTVCGAPDVQRNSKIIADREGGATIVWTDKGGGSYDIYSQRINKSGQAQWLTDGIPVCQAPRTQQNPQLASPTIVAWEDYRSGNWDIFANSITSDGKVAWGEEGSPVASLPMTQYAPQIISWKDDRAILTWEDYRNGKQYEIYLQQLNAKGSADWQPNGTILKTSNGARAPQILPLSEGNSFVVIWEDYTNGGKAIFGQRFVAD